MPPAILPCLPDDNRSVFDRGMHGMPVGESDVGPCHGVYLPAVPDRLYPGPEAELNFLRLPGGDIPGMQVTILHALPRSDSSRRLVPAR